MVHKISLNHAIIAILVTTAIATILSVNPGISLWGIHKRYDGFVNLVVYVFLFYIIVMTTRRQDIDKFIIAFIVVGVITSIYGICQKFGIDPFPGLVGKKWSVDYSIRPGSTFGGAVFFASYLLIVVLLSLYMAIKSVGWKRWLYVVCLWLFVYAIVLTQCRGALVGLGVGLTFFAILSQHYKIFKVIGGMLVFVVVLSILMSGSAWVRTVSQVKTPLSQQGKFKAAVVGWELIKDRPWFGSGPDCLRFVMPEKYIGIYDNSSIKDWKRIHNEWFDITVDTGFVGLSAWLFFYIMYFRLVCRDRHSMITVVLGSCVLGYLVINQFNFGMTPNILVFWYLIGLTVVSANESYGQLD